MRRKGKLVALAGSLMVSLLLLSCGTQVRARTILPAEEAHIVEFSPDGRYIAHGASILDVATGEEVQVPEVSGMHWIGDGLLYGSSGHTEIDQRIKYVVNWPPLSVVRLEKLSEENLSARIQEANLFYVFGMGSGKYQLLILSTDSSGQVIQGYHVDGVEDPDQWLAGRPYETEPPPIGCGKRRVSPDGRYYYDYTYGESVQIYSKQGELVNSMSATGLNCYGWAWDSSGVYVQERRIGMFVMNPYFGPLLLLDADE